MRKDAGFTFVEALVTLAVIAACASAATAMHDFIVHQRSHAVMSRLVAHMANARLAAITRNIPTVICPLNQEQRCSAGTDWSEGWMTFVDGDGDRRPATSEDVLNVEQVSAGGALRIQTSMGRRHLRYLADGRSAGSNVSFRICDRDDRLLGTVTVNNAGRVRSERPDKPLSCAR